MRRAALAAAALALAATTPDAFRFSRPIEAPSGWTRLALPDDVLDACRPGLPDLRIEDEAGKAIPFALQQDAASDERRFPVVNLESLDKLETSGQIDRGAGAGLADAVTFEISGTDFLKPVHLQASDDAGSWKDVARGSVFATGDVRMLTLPMPPTARRYLRFRLDDRNGDPVRPEALRVRSRSASPAGAAPARPLSLSPLPTDAGTVARYTAVLPAANLGLTALRFQADDPAFSRRARVYERVLFRDEVCRRLVAEGVLAKAPGGENPIDLPMDGVTGRTLELEIDDGDSPPLSGLQVAVLATPRSLRFFAPAGAHLRLFYGSPSAPAPRYDVARALDAGNPEKVAEATLGAATSGAEAPPAVKAPSRAPLPDSQAWTVRRPIRLPSSGNVAYLDFEDLPRGFADLRIVDERNDQVPFVVERGSHEHRVRARLALSADGSRTLARLEDAGRLSSADAIELSASAPDYFSRDVAVIEELRDSRGVTGRQRLGFARWERKPGEPAPVLRIPIGRPGRDAAALIVEIDNGDNVPLTLTGAEVLRASYRIDFVFQPGDRLCLLSGNPEIRAPRYDLELLAGAVLASPAAAAGLEPSPEAIAPRAGPPPWLWGAIGITVALLLFALRRTLRANPTGL